MKRFYCTICKKVKRVRNIPSRITTPSAPKVKDRTGICDRHNTSDIAKYDHKAMLGGMR